MSEPAPGSAALPNSSQLPRTVGFWGAVALMAGICIGGGIFRNPAEIAQNLGNPWVIIAMWVVGGLVALCGAFTYAELAVMFPRSGGVYVFLREGFGRPIAFVFGWTYLLVSKPAAAGGIAIVFAEHLNPLLGVEWDKRITTCVVLTILTAISTPGMWLGTGVAKFLTAIKVLALLFIIATAAALGSGLNPHPFASTPDPKPFFVAAAAVMVSIAWAYDGWSDVGAIAEEVKDPNQTLPRIYFAGTAAVILLYVAVNLAYFYVLPLEDMRAVDTVAPLAMQRLLGNAGGVIISVIILVSTIGSSHGSIITGARVSFAQARDGLLFRFLAHVHPRFKTPAVSLWFQLALSCIAVMWLESFENLTAGFVFTMWIFYGMAGACLFILRWRQPDRPRLYRCWGYPVTPILFIAASIWMTVMVSVGKPALTLICLLILIAGIPAYYIWNYATQRFGDQTLT